MAKAWGIRPQPGRLTPAAARQLEPLARLSLVRAESAPEPFFGLYSFYGLDLRGADGPPLGARPGSVFVAGRPCRSRSESPTAAAAVESARRRARRLSRLAEAAAARLAEVAEAAAGERAARAAAQAAAREAAAREAAAALVAAAAAATAARAAAAAGR